MKSKKRMIPLIVILACSIVFIGLIAYGIHWAFFDIQRIDGQEVITVSESPDSLYTVTAYLNNGGATTDYAVLCSVKNNETGIIFFRMFCFA